MTTLTPTLTRTHGVGADTQAWRWTADELAPLIGDIVLDAELRERLSRPVQYVDVPEEFPRTEAQMARKDQSR